MTEIDKTPLHKQYNINDLTILQKQVMLLILEEHLGQAEIGRRLKTSRQNINQIVNRLKKYGLLDKQNLTALHRGGVVTIKKSVSIAKWRYHKLHFVVKPFYFEPRYQSFIKKDANIVYHGDWRFVFHEDIVEVQIRELVDFESENKWDAIDKMTHSFNKYLNIVSSKYGFHVFKDMKANVRICDQHLECSNSGVAKGKGNKNYVAIKGFHDGKIFFTFDSSKGLTNHEYIHSNLAISDSEKFEPFFNSIRYHEHYLPHEIKGIVDHLQSDYVSAQKDFTDKMNWLAENLKSHQQVLSEIRDAIKELKELKK